MSRKQARKMLKKPVLPINEPRECSLSLKIKSSMMDAIEQAAVDNQRTKSSLACDVIEIWLREQGYLK
jgi:hypothetical protein